LVFGSGETDWVSPGSIARKGSGTCLEVGRQTIFEIFRRESQTDLALDTDVPYSSQIEDLNTFALFELWIYDKICFPGSGTMTFCMRTEKQKTISKTHTRICSLRKERCLIRGGWFSF
jgi:hypothetical protein